MKGASQRRCNCCSHSFRSVGALAHSSSVLRFSESASRVKFRGAAATRTDMSAVLDRIRARGAELPSAPPEELMAMSERRRGGAGSPAFAAVELPEDLDALLAAPGVPPQEGHLRLSYWRHYRRCTPPTPTVLLQTLTLTRMAPVGASPAPPLRRDRASCCAWTAHSWKRRKRNLTRLT